jgi:RNA polymerase sigma factor (sigma-70 family)
MDERTWLAERFEAHRGHMRAVAYRLLGSLSEADDAVQETWLRLSTADAAAVENLGGWLTTVIGRVSLDKLRARRRSEAHQAFHVPEPIVNGPEEQAQLADAIGLALLVVLETLEPAERVAFVLHDMFDVPFEQIAPMVGRNEEAARQLASRARRRVRGASVPDGDRARQRAIVDAYVAAARTGDLEAIVALLDPDVVLRSDRGAERSRGSRAVRGAEAVATGALAFRHLALQARPVLVNGDAGFVVFDPKGKPFSVVSFTISGGKIVEIDVLADPDRLATLDLSAIH